MPLSSDVRASRRPLPRQLDLESWADTFSSSRSRTHDSGNETSCYDRFNDSESLPSHVHARHDTLRDNQCDAFQKEQSLSTMQSKKQHKMEDGSQAPPGRISRWDQLERVNSSSRECSTGSRHALSPVESSTSSTNESSLDDGESFVSNDKRDSCRHADLPRASSLHLSLDRHQSEASRHQTDAKSPLASPSDWARFQPHSIESTVSSTPSPASPSRLSQSPLQQMNDSWYEFRRQMRETFIRVEDMVDVHRSLFQSDPSSKNSIVQKDLELQAERVASETFHQLASLRNRFARLANETSGSKRAEEGLSIPKGASNFKEGSRKKEVPFIPSNQDENDVFDDKERVVGCRDRKDKRWKMDVGPTSRDGIETYTDLSSWKESGSDVDSNSIGKHELTRTFDDASSISNRYSKGKPTETDGIFKDFDKRMEQIRSSLHAIASGKHARNRHLNDTSGRRDANFTMGETSSMMGTNLTVRRPFGRFDDEGMDSDRLQASGREVEVRQLLKELNRVHARLEDES